MRADLLVVVLVVCIIVAAFAAGGRFAVTTPAVYQQLLVSGWDVANGRYKPDSSRVLFDKSAHVPFTTEEAAVLDSLGAIIISDEGVEEYLKSNGWNRTWK